MARFTANQMRLVKFKRLRLPNRKLKSFDAVSAVTLDGNMCMYDISKFIKLSTFKIDSEFVDCKFWDQRKLFASTSSVGELILNGSGNNREHIRLPISGGDPINDFEIVDDNYLLFGCDDSFVYLFDVRKGIVTQ